MISAHRIAVSRIIAGSLPIIKCITCFLRLRQDDIRPVFHLQTYASCLSVPCTAIQIEGDGGDGGSRRNRKADKGLPRLVGHCLSHPGPQDIVPGHSRQSVAVAGLLIRVGSQAVAVGHRALAVVAVQQRLAFLLSFGPAANRKPEVQRGLRNKHRLGLGSKGLLRKNSGVAHLGASSLRGLSRNPLGGIHRFLKGLAAGRIPAANLAANRGIIAGPVILRLIPVMDRFHRNIKCYDAAAVHPGGPLPATRKDPHALAEVFATIGNQFAINGVGSSALKGIALVGDITAPACETSGPSQPVFAVFGISGETPSLGQESGLRPGCLVGVNRRTGGKAVGSRGPHAAERRF